MCGKVNDFSWPAGMKLGKRFTRPVGQTTIRYLY